MKRRYLLVFSMILFCFTLFVGCNTTNDDKKVVGLQVSVINKNLDCTDNTITVQYNANVSEPVVSDDFEVKAIRKDGTTLLIGKKTDVDRGYLYSTTFTSGSVGVGKYTITFSYDQVESVEYTVIVNKADYDTSHFKWDYSEAYTYDGQEKIISLLDVPSNIRVEYSGNTGIDAGKYTARADLYYVDSQNYNSLASVYVDWYIVKDIINFKYVYWDYQQPFTYDGAEKLVQLVNLPSMVTPLYCDNQKTEIGKYTATVDFIYDTKNYELADFDYRTLQWEIK